MEKANEWAGGAAYLVFLISIFFRAGADNHVYHET